jgi:predicted aminopeptidase
MNIAKPLALWLMILMFGAGTTACTKVGYYSQAIGGQLSILSKRQPIEALIADPQTDPQLRSQLKLVLAARAFASNELALPDNKSYRTYVDLKRPYAVWNVFAAPELSLDPLQWCFVFVGCLNYRGYFSADGAEKFAAKLHEQGHDVYVAGIVAYSTLGWFHDPVLNTMLRSSNAEVAGLIFHELAHQRLYVRDDTEFNESFAMTVEREGVKRWLAHSGSEAEFRGYETVKQRRQQFIELIMQFRQRLKDVYGSDQPVDAKRAAKATLLGELRQSYKKLREQWDGYAGYDAWFAQDLNNAHLVPIGLYNQYVPAFQALLTQHSNDLRAFSEAVDELGKLSNNRDSAGAITRGARADAS